MKRSLLVLLLLVTGLSARAQNSNEFRAAIERVQKNPGTLAADEVAKFLQQARDLNRPYTAAVAAKAYFAQNLSVPGPLLKAAAENAALAGDFRTAASRYKQFLRTAPAGAETSEAAAQLYQIQVDFLGATDDAYRFMDEVGDNLRQSVAAKKFDRWFLSTARDRKQPAALARRLALVLADQMPLELERFYYWEFLDYLITELSVPRPELADVIPACQRLSPLIRNSPRFQTRFQFLVAVLAARVNAGGPADKDFSAMTTAAQAYLDAAPTGDTFREINNVFNNARFAETIANRMLAVRGEIFQFAFQKFSDAERASFMARPDVNGGLASPAQWTDLAVQYPAVFRQSPSSANLPFAANTNDLVLLKKQAEALHGVPGTRAALVNTLAAGDVRGAWLIQQESWNLSGPELYDIFRNLPSEAPGRLQLKFGAEQTSQSPLAFFHPDAARDYIYAAWRFGDKAKLAGSLHTLDWVPYTIEQRKAIFSGAATEFKQWSTTARQGLEVAKKSTDAAKIAEAEAQVALIAPLEEQFKQVLDPAISDPSKGPTPLCQYLAKAVVASRAKDSAAFLTAARGVYALVRDYDTKHTPFGSLALAFLLQPRPDTVDFQLEILADQLTRYDSAGASRALRETLAALQSSDRGRARKIADALAKVLLEQLAKNQFNREIFDWFRAARRAPNQVEQNLHPEVLAKMIEQKVLLQSDYRIERSATCTYQWLIANEFNLLAKDFPVTSYFDAMFADEVRRTRFVDAQFWQYSTDEKHLAANAAAEVLGDCEKYPFGYENEKNVYGRQQFFDVHWRAMAADSAARNGLLTKLETFAGKTRFDGYATGAAWLYHVADASTEAGRKQYFAKLDAVVNAAATVPARVTPPNLIQLARLNPAKLSADELNSLIRFFNSCVPVTWTANNYYDTLEQLVFDNLRAQKRDGELFALLPHFWKIAKDSGNPNFQRSVVQAGNALDGDLAAVNSAIGLDFVGGALPEDARNTLLALRSKSLAAIGAVIPVERGDRRYPVFAAQADFLAGKFDSAWQQLATSRDMAGQLYKELDPAFNIWLVEKNTELGNYDDADGLARTLIQWVDSAPQSFDSEIRARLLVSFASIAFARQEFPRARAQFAQVANAQEFAGTQAKRDAELKIAEVDRLTKHYDTATELLDKLAHRKDAYLQAQANYQLALVKFDQELYPEARQSLEQVFAIEPTHANARILEGKLYLKLKKLVEATEVRVGLAADQQTIIPGVPLKIQLEDRNLATAGKSANIEVRVWADSGDEEIFSLVPFGDSKTKFEGTLPTMLGAPKKGDRILQLLGGDLVHFDYSEKFKQLHPAITGKLANNITVAADAELYISSSKILSKAEQEQRALEATIRARLSTDEIAAPTVALSTVRADNEIKPGAPINVRIVDPAASKTAGKNTVTVRATTTSGDRIDAFSLDETAPYTGVFEGKIPTASATATAFASDSEEGHEPNFAIAQGDYPAWVGLADNRRPKIFNVDMNDNVALGKLTILADVPGRHLKSFVVQTSLNGKEFANAGTWPTTVPAWDGTARWEIAPFVGATPPTALDQFRDYLDAGYLAAGVTKTLRPGTEKLAVTADGWSVARWSGAFQLSARQLRNFRVNFSKQIKNVRFLLTVDGQPGLTPIEITRSLGKGVHRLDLYICAQRTAAVDYELVAEETTFDAKWPAELPAQIGTNATMTAFTVTFATGSRARVLRLWLTDFETDAPAIKKLTLTSATGQPVLPAAVDIVSARKNQILKIVPGDRITVTYDNPHAISKDKQSVDANLTATYHNATLSACFIDSIVDASGNRKAQYIPMRRFKPGDTINVFINDADGDVSDAPDKVKFWAQAGEGKRIELEALETDAHSGVFLGKVFPVTGAPTRPSEITVGKDEDVTVGYLDEENTDPGIPWERQFVVEQTAETQPMLRVYDVTSRQLTAAELTAGARSAEAKHIEEFIPVTRTLTASWSNSAPTALIGVPMLVDLVYPTIAQSFQSEAKLAVQAGPPREFDPAQPGTVTLRRPVGDAGTIPPPPGYRQVTVRGNPKANDPLEDGRFTFIVPITLGATSTNEDSLVDVSIHVPSIDQHGETRWSDRPVKVPALGVKPGDEIRVAFQVGPTNWITQHVALKADAFFDVMERRYQEPLATLHVGESLYFRLADPLRDVSDEKDQVAITLLASSGGSNTVKLTETFPHSGIFKGKADVVFAGDVTKTNGTDAVPVKYGDTVRAIYRTGEVERSVEIFKGAAGEVLPFTKRFQDSEIAVETQFTVAEAYFEMAKKHRELGQEDLAHKEIAQGKKLLEEAIRDYPNTAARAQADYLLADLAYEGAKDVSVDEAKKRYAEAIVRFSDIVATYPDSTYAPKAQYKKALIFEKTGQMDLACEEYVKLSYRYPDNELVAETITQLGKYFRAKGKELQDAAKAETDKVAREKGNMQAHDMFKTAAQVYGRLAQRFPEHKFAGAATVLSAECWMLANDLTKAIEVFRQVIDEKKAEPDLIARAMFWAGDCYTKLGQPDYVNAYRLFKRLTWDYPESQSAKYARGRLAEDALAKIEQTDSVTNEK